MAKKLIGLYNVKLLLEKGISDKHISEAIEESVKKHAKPEKKK